MSGPLTLEDKNIKRSNFMDNLEDITLSGMRQTHGDAQCVIPRPQGPQSWQRHTGGKQVGGCQGLGRGLSVSWGQSLNWTRWGRFWRRSVGAVA